MVVKEAKFNKAVERFKQRHSDHPLESLKKVLIEGFDMEQEMNAVIEARADAGEPPFGDDDLQLLVDAVLEQYNIRLDKKKTGLLARVKKVTSYL